MLPGRLLTRRSAAPPPMTDAAKQEQKKAIIAARIKALPYWTDLRLRYPKSRFVPQALYHLGLLYADAEKPDGALAAFEELSTKYPDSPWTGDAQVWLIDVKLDRQFDLPGASSLAAAAVDWYEHIDKAKAAQSRKDLGDDQSDDLHSAKQVGYDIYVRAGLVEYLREHNDRAVTFFEKAKPLQPERTYVVAHGKIPTGIERLIETAKSGKSLTPDVVRQGDEQAKLILMLADIYFQGREFAKSWELCNRLIYSDAIARATREQRSYAHYKRARSCYCLHGKARKPDAALADYVVAVRTAPRRPGPAPRCSLPRTSCGTTGTTPMPPCRFGIA